MKWDGGAFKCANLGGGGGGGRSLLETQPFACAVFCHLFNGNFEIQLSRLARKP